jgi:hypothetical protein
MSCTTIYIHAWFPVSANGVGESVLPEGTGRMSELFKERIWGGSGAVNLRQRGEREDVGGPEKRGSSWFAHQIPLARRAGLESGTGSICMALQKTNGRL